MAEKEVTVKVSAEVDKAEVEDLEDTLKEMQDNKVVISPEVESMELDEVEARIEEIREELESDYILSLAVDDPEIEALEAELAELEQRQIDLTVNVDDSGLDELSNKMDDVESKSSETSDAISSIGGAATGIAAAAGLEQMITTADNINNSWNRLSLTFGNTGVSMDDLKSKTNQLQQSTGQAGGTIRNFFNMMGVAGVTNTNAISQSFEALSGKAYQMGVPVDQLECSHQWV